MSQLPPVSPPPEGVEEPQPPRGHVRVIYLGPVARFLQTQSFFAPPVLGLETPPERSMDLDHPHQWALAEALLQSQLSPAR